MRILKWVVSVLVAFFLAATYVMTVSFSEHREYTANSLLSYLLTPTKLSAISARCEDQPVFVYSSADGPKPTIVIMRCRIPKHDFEQQMKLSGCQYIEKDLYQRKDAQIQITTSLHEEQVTSVVFIGSN